MRRSIARFPNLHALTHLSRILLPSTLRTVLSHFSLSSLVFTYAHSETHGRSRKKIKEKTILSIGGSFSHRSRSMAHGVTDTCNIYTYTRAHTTCAHNTYMDCVLDSRLCLFLRLFLSFFF